MGRYGSGRWKDARAPLPGGTKQSIPAPKPVSRPCPDCGGKGCQLWIYPSRTPTAAYWFNRGPGGEKPSTCETCDGTGEA